MSVPGNQMYIQLSDKLGIEGLSKVVNFQINGGNKTHCQGTIDKDNCAGTYSPWFLVVPGSHYSRSACILWTVLTTTDHLTGLSKTLLGPKQLCWGETARLLAGQGA